ncbi:clusterin-associated protein 1 [Phlebotomus argentipes]|uniref:clusterin-associated protein 1 n=1 Tax=Phlebotomus argentipes TaxID=94469 RepID=UPI002893792D|nr:clusterin-associated protein 1 [Phlebotomus argentipes]
MTFNDVRDLTEHLKLLGYPDFFPMSALYTPYGSASSFKIVASVLNWLAARLEPGTILLGGTETEAERVLLIRAASEFFITKAGIKVNPRKLYASSVASAKELLKITSVLIHAPNDVKAQEDEVKSANEIDLSDKIEDLRRVRELSTELTNRGASLYDLLGKEPLNKETREHQANRPMELSSVEHALVSSFASMQGKVQSAKSYLEQSREEVTNLNSRLQRKQQELDRSRQRLLALQKVRPSYLEEFEKLEEELNGLFDIYLTRHRSVDALKNSLGNRDSSIEAALESPQQRNAAENSMTVLPEGLLDSDDEEEDNMMRLKDDVAKGRDETARKEPEIVARKQSANRLRIRTGAMNRGERRVIGAMGGTTARENRFDSSLGSDDTDSELDMQDFDGDEIPSDDDDSDSLANLAREGAKSVRQDQSDEDF